MNKPPSIVRLLGRGIANNFEQLPFQKELADFLDSNRAAKVVLIKSRRLRSIERLLRGLAQDSVTQ